MCNSLLPLVTGEFNVHCLVTPRYCRIQCALLCYSSFLVNSMCTYLLSLATAEFNVHSLATPSLLYNSMCNSLLTLVTGEFNVHCLVTLRYCRIRCALPCYPSLLLNSMCTSLLLLVTGKFNLHFPITPRNVLVCISRCVRRTTDVPRHASLKLLWYDTAFRPHRSKFSARLIQATWTHHFSGINTQPFKARGLQYASQKVYILHTQCIHVCCVDLRTNCDYFPIQH
jgi:hypothetical protein